MTPSKVMSSYCKLTISGCGTPVIAYSQFWIVVTLTYTWLQEHDRLCCKRYKFSISFPYLTGMMLWPFFYSICYWRCKSIALTQCSHNSNSKSLMLRVFPRQCFVVSWIPIENAIIVSSTSRLLHIIAKSLLGFETGFFLPPIQEQQSGIHRLK